MTRLYVTHFTDGGYSVANARWFQVASKDQLVDREEVLDLSDGEAQKVLNNPKEWQLVDGLVVPRK